jgi:hypothetical protein
MAVVMPLVTNGTDLLPLAEKATSLSQVKRTKLLEKHYVQSFKNMAVQKLLQKTTLSDGDFQQEVYSRVVMPPNMFYLLRLGGKKSGPITYKIGITSRTASLRKSEIQTGQHGKVTVLFEKNCEEDGLNRTIEDLLKKALADLNWTADGGSEVFQSPLSEDQVIRGITGFVNDIISNGIGSMDAGMALSALKRYGFHG